jgi:AraC-like DNA-binding protein
MGLVTGGNGSHAIDLNELDLSRGSLFLILPNQVHHLTKSVDLKGHAVLFNDQVIANWRGHLPAWTLLRTQQRFQVRVAPAALPAWTRRFKDIVSELSVGDRYTMDAVGHSIGLFLIHVVRLIQDRPAQRPKVPQDFLYNFQQLIEQHFRDLKSPSQYADQLHITANYLNSLCKIRAVKSAGELIRQRILLEAKRLLAHSDKSVSEIAFQLQFEDNSYFGRFFKRYTGKSPGVFRKQHRL